MTTEVLLIQLTPQLHIPGTLARHDAGTPQAVKDSVLEECFPSMTLRTTSHNAGS